MTLTVTQAEAQVILNHLADGKWAEVNPLMGKLIGQVNDQLKAASGASTPPPKEGKSP